MLYLNINEMIGLCKIKISVDIKKRGPRNIGIRLIIKEVEREKEGNYFNGFNCYYCYNLRSVFAYSRLNRIKRQELPKNDADLGITQPVAEEQKPDILNIAFFGLDARNPDYASRSDTIMVVSIDRKSQKVKVTSLMRDMYIPIPGKGDNRINAAYAFGGPALAVKTINSSFGLDIRNFATVNFFGLEKLIDKVGGIEIDVKKNEVPYINAGVSEVTRLEKDNKFTFVKQPGIQTLNGRQAVAYARIRYTGNSDYERTERQRRVVDQLFKKIKAQGPLKLPGIIDSLLPYVETSLSNGEILSLAQEAIKFNTDGIEQFRLPVDGLFKSQSIRGMSVLVPDIEANKEKLHEFIYGKVPAT